MTTDNYNANYSDKKATNDNEDYHSKSELKKIAQNYKDIAQKVINLNVSQLNKMGISEELFNAVTTAKKLKQNNALRRQLSYISKLIQTGENESIIKEEFSRIEQHDINYKHITKQAELWRERLLSDDNDAITEFITSFSIDKQQLNQVIRNTKKEQKKNKDKNTTENKHYKNLFIMIRESLLSR